MPKRIKWLALVLIVPVLGMVYSWTQDQKRKQSISIPDGTILTFLTATGGTIHRVSWGPNWNRLLDWLPSTIRIYLPHGANEAEVLTETDSVCAWFLPQDASASELFAAISGDDGIETLTPVERHPSDPGKAIFRTFPTDSPALSMRLFTRHGRFSLKEPFEELRGAEFTFPNPLYGKRAALGATTPPIAMLDEESYIELTSLTVNPSRKGNELKWLTDAQAVFKLQGPHNHWELGTVTAEDRWGMQMPGIRYDNIAGNACYHFPDYPVATEAWKLKIEYIRISKFQPEDYLVFEKIPIPEKEGLVPLDITRQSREMFVTIKSVYFAEGMNEGSIQVEVSRLRENAYITLVEPKGKPTKRDVRLPPMYRLHFNCPSLPIATSATAIHGEWAVPFIPPLALTSRIAKGRTSGPPHGASSFSITLAVHLSQHAEIIKQPKLLPAPIAPSPVRAD